MKIRLINFLCYEDTTYDFGNDGMVLLSGPSGSGKSSVCRGIFFALYGEGTKVHMYGKSSCKVELWVDGLHVVRTRRPNRLVLNESVEDDEAQAIIDQKFGSMFRSTGYIQQNNLTSFILFSPAEKLSFLEKWLFFDVALTAIRDKTIHNLKLCQKELDESALELEKTERILADLPQIEPDIFPIEHPSLNISRTQRVDFHTSEICDKLIRNTQIKHKNSEIKIRKLETESRKLEERQERQRSSIYLLQRQVQTHRSLCEQIESCKSEQASIEIDQPKLEQYTSSLSMLSKQRWLRVKTDQLQTLQQQIAEQEVEEQKSLKQSIDQLKLTLWTEIAKDEIDTSIEQTQSALSDRELILSLQRSIQPGEELKIDEINRLKDQLADLNFSLEKSQLHLKTTKINLHCPGCDLPLRLHMTSDGCTLTDRSAESTTEIDLNKPLSDSADSAETAEVVETVKAVDRIDQIDVLRAQIESIQSRISTGKSLYKMNSKIRKRIQEIEEPYEDLPPLSELKDNLEQLKTYRQSQIEAEKKLTQLLKQKSERVFSRYLERLKIDADKIEKELSTSGVSTAEIQSTQVESLISDADEELMRQFCAEQRESVHRLKNLDKKLETLNQTLVQLKAEINSSIDGEQTDPLLLLVDLEQRSLEIDTKLKQCKIELRQQLETNKTLVDHLKRVDRWKTKAVAISNRFRWSTDRSRLLERLQLAQTNFTAAQELRQVVLEAESRYLQETLDSINGHAQIYLDLFFVDAPIQVRLQSFKQTKKEVKPQINVEVEYKGMESDLTFLSGGELSRVVLAFTMALGEIFNSPLLLLDECTASLDQDLSSVIFESLKDQLKNKLVIVIAHQTIKGSFDRCLETQL